MEEQSIITKINSETQLLNDEIQHLMSSYKEEKKQCDELKLACLLYRITR